MDLPVQERIEIVFDRVNILGVGVDAVDLSRAVQAALAFLTTGEKGYICVTGMHGIMESQLDSAFREIQNNSFLTIPDGIPTVWIGRSNGYTNMAQVRGADFMLGFCERSVDQGIRHFLYGGKPGVAELLRDVLSLRFPGLQIVGTYTPPFRPLNAQEEVELRQQLLDSHADVLWCGISTPKQERFMATYVHNLPVRLMVGVGAAFDLNAGLLQDSPRWVQRWGLQWAHRLFQEPRRLWKRYLLNIPKFIGLYFLQRLGVRRYESPVRTPVLSQFEAVPMNKTNSQQEGGQVDIAA